jgi:excisionase family DNA binding protein
VGRPSKAELQAAASSVYTTNLVPATSAPSIAVNPATPSLAEALALVVSLLPLANTASTTSVPAPGEHELDVLMTVEEVADYLGTTPANLYVWRSRGQGPRAAKVGRYLKYSRRDVLAWLEAQKGQAA